MASRHKFGQFLNELLTVQMATINNFYHPNTETYNGSVHYPRLLFEKAEKYELIKKIEVHPRPLFPRREYFYFLTKKGANYIGRADNFKQKLPKSINNLQHESLKIDIALGFVRAYPDYNYVFDYNKIIDGLKPDIFIKMTSKDLSKSFSFLVENERKQKPKRTYDEKLIKYEEMFKKIDLKKNGLSDKTKVLVVFSNLDYNGYLRPVEYPLPDSQEQIRIVKRNFDHLIEICLKNKIASHRYRFMPSYDFYRLGEAVWHTVYGEPLRLI